MSEQEPLSAFYWRENMIESARQKFRREERASALMRERILHLRKTMTQSAVADALKVSKRYVQRVDAETKIAADSDD